MLFQKKLHPILMGALLGFGLSGCYYYTGGASVYSAPYYYPGYYSPYYAPGYYGPRFYGGYRYWYFGGHGPRYYRGGYHHWHR
jgi:hypothetical protein